MRAHRSVTVVLVAAMVLAACGGAGETTDAGAAAPTDTAEPPAATPDTTPTTEQAQAPAGDAIPDDSAAADDTPATDETHAGDRGMAMDDPSHMDDDTAMGDFGEEADPADADRVIDVTVDNTFAFQPADFEVAVGEVVTFRIENIGDLEHEFVLGDEAAQERMGEMMAEQQAAGEAHAHAAEVTNAVTVHGGETEELTWRFTTPGTVLVGCHVSGHWEAGMRGSVDVS